MLNQRKIINTTTKHGSSFFNMNLNDPNDTVKWGMEKGRPFFVKYLPLLSILKLKLKLKLNFSVV